MPDPQPQPAEPRGQTWREFTHPTFKLCGLCGNTGWIDTRDTVESPAGVRCGVLKPCICPNGRQVKDNPKYGQLALPERSRR